MRESYIAIDWGSTNFRAWLYLNGECTDHLESEAGLPGSMAVLLNRFSATHFYPGKLIRCRF